MDNQPRNIGYNLTKLSFETLSPDSEEMIQSWSDKKEKVVRHDWHLYFILQANLIATRSLDPQTQCGCVLVKNNTIIGTGYNSFVGNIRDSVLPNLRNINDQSGLDKYPFMLHSEHNAILNCAKNGVSCKGAKAYITGPPCCGCLQYMYQAGISEIYYANNNRAHMCANKEYETQFEILAHLMHNMKIFCLDLDENTLDKIGKIKSVRS